MPEAFVGFKVIRKETKTPKRIIDAEITLDDSSGKQLVLTYAQLNSLTLPAIGKYSRDRVATDALEYAKAVLRPRGSPPPNSTSQHKL